jgi:5'-nucleotidase
LPYNPNHANVGMFKQGFKTMQQVQLKDLPKGEFLKEFEPDFFFDDQTGHIESAARHVPAGHVASGISNN